MIVCQGEIMLYIRFLLHFLTIWYRGFFCKWPCLPKLPKGYDSISLWWVGYNRMWELYRDESLIPRCFVIVRRYGISSWFIKPLTKEQKEQLFI